MQFAGRVELLDRWEDLYNWGALKWKEILTSSSRADRTSTHEVTAGNPDEFSTGLDGKIRHIGAALDDPEAVGRGVAEPDGCGGLGVIVVCDGCGDVGPVGAGICVGGSLVSPRASVEIYFI
jgi:hypothetical protein